MGLKRHQFVLEFMTEAAAIEGNHAMSTTLAKQIRIDSEQWERIEATAKERNTTANQLVVDLAIGALGRQEWPRTDLEIHMFRSCLFSAQAIARDMIAAGREDEVEEIRKDVSQIAPELPDDQS